MPFPEKAITGEFGTMSEFRRKRGMQAHSGTDWSPAGSNKGKTPIPAVAKGTIKLIQWSNVLGWVVVQTAMDKDRAVWYLGYCHVSCRKCGVNCKGGHDASIASSLKVGDKVAPGDSLGMMGNTGNASSGVHLHATASKNIKGVFGPTSAKSDLKKLIKANQGVDPKPKSAAPEVNPVAQPATPVAEKPVAPVTPKPVTVAPATVPVSQEPLFHKVVSGDTLGRIALMYRVTIAELAALNSIQDVNKISVGQMIRLRK
jgi:murein DD-endopeptidase MepM/ murein hydrolase activator NlpD